MNGRHSMQKPGLTERRRCEVKPAVSALVWSAIALFVSSPELYAQLNQNCIVSVLNRNTPVNADGSWILPNVPANFGLVRARANCLNGGITTSGQSNSFLLGANGTVNLPHIQLG